MEKIPYKLIRSRRKSLGLELRPEGLIVRAPLSGPRTDRSNILWSSTASGSDNTRRSWSDRNDRQRNFPPCCCREGHRRRGYDVFPGKAGSTDIDLIDANGEKERHIRVNGPVIGSAVRLASIQTL